MTKSSSKKILTIFTPLLRFFREQSISGFLLIAATIIAIGIANSSIGDSFINFWKSSVTIPLSNHFQFEFTIDQFINDGLMTVFFIVVGLELKRELIQGELSSKEKALLPVIGAIGGMAVPALIFIFLNYGKSELSGWAIPTATDIAFSLTVLSLLGNRVPLSLKVFLTALAVVDDLGAIVIIALFYSHDIHLLYLFYSSLVVLVLMIMNKKGVKNIYLYLFVGSFLWIFLHHAGIHATISGVILAMTVPFRSKDEKEETDETKIPLNKMLHLFSVFSSYFIMPLFALSNAGIKLEYSAMAELGSTMSLGIIAGLFLGKPIGITLMTYITTKLKITKIPSEVKWSTIFCVNILAGIGFTMSIFVTKLAYTDQRFIETAKFSIIIASFFSGMIGYLVLRFLNSDKTENVIS